MKRTHYLLVGTYTSGKSKGIYVYGFDENTGGSEFLHAVEIENPSYLINSQDGKHIYSVSENAEGQVSYSNSFLFNKQNGEIKLLNRQKTKGDSPCYIQTDRMRKHVVAANYAGGSISVFDIESDGSLSNLKQLIQFHGRSIHPERQTESHLHCVKFSPDGKYLFATDLGADKIYRFELDKSGKADFLGANNLISFNITSGSGPRHLLFHPNRDYLYLINELSGTVMTFKYNDGDLKWLQTIEIDITENGEAGDIDITPDGRFLYASSRTENDGVAVFAINKADGMLEKKDYINTGIHPRNVTVTPNGKFLLVANKDSNSIEIYEIDKENGNLKDIPNKIKLEQPVCMIFI